MSICWRLWQPWLINLWEIRTSGALEHLQRFSLSQPTVETHDRQPLAPVGVELQHAGGPGLRGITTLAKSLDRQESRSLTAQERLSGQLVPLPGCGKARRYSRIAVMRYLDGAPQEGTESATLCS